MPVADPPRRPRTLYLCSRSSVPGGRGPKWSAGAPAVAYLAWRPKTPVADSPRRPRTLHLCSRSGLPGGRGLM